MVSVEFKGGRALEAALSELKTATAKGVARRVLKKAGQPLVAKASALAPRASGNLAESYVVTSRLSKAQRREARSGPKDDVKIYVGTNNPAGVQQEFGNANHAAQPHFRPAWDGLKGSMLDQIAKDMGTEVEKAVKRARRKALRG